MKVNLLSPEELTTLGIGVSRKVYFPENVRELRYLLRENLPVIGGGSNVVLTESKTPLISTLLFKEVNLDGDTLTLGAGIGLSQVLKLQIEKGFSLFEPLSGIPKATVGGIVAQNAGAFGWEVKDSLLSVVYLDRETGEVLRMGREEILKSFRYRETPFPKKGLILKAVFRVKRDRKVREKIERYVRERLTRHPPFYLKTAGSTFKNPPGTSAGKLLDLLGFRGFRVGNVRFSEVHANFLVNSGGSYSEFKEIVGLAVEKVKEKFGLKLELEVKPL